MGIFFSRQWTDIGDGGEGGGMADLGGQIRSWGVVAPTWGNKSRGFALGPPGGTAGCAGGCGG